MHPIRVTDRWEVLGMDLIGPFHETSSGHKYVLTMTDLFTKWIVAKPIPDKGAAAVAEVVLSTFYLFGPPRRIITDQGREFVNEVCCNKLMALNYMKLYWLK
jgi:hypothetical protein